ncbi:MAG: TIGR02221 family CRISPR-associated protein [Cyanomargarita calcarea GSE-NOS-MK-12-04C]|jgi:CRISPR-associated Csx2 family protein|uniref:TIGR02221 family CRISPR-associated protein n=1 Tax=Cyanomargarita calcarea GSE-NOS-MK-12-04C TaxID=2839659 RepID=A0A951QRV7_9CYAN|nr:TIGR02221 family CRISPR-associated protein [Cyanomargarita calcarea GSE-NOS-MK-12-04C]
MAKILISPIGIGGRFKNDDTSDRQYQETCYKIGDKSYNASRFMASVLYEHFNLDGIIFIGTVKSMWEEIYRFFCDKNGLTMDGEYWLDLACKSDTFNNESELDSLDLSKVEQVLGNHSKCILTKYGLNETELWDNFDKIFEIVNFLNKDDEIYIDITHSFRSLSLFLFLTVTFIQDLVPEKNIKIAGVYYGMLDVTRELGYTPVVDLKSLFDMTSWIKGAYSLQSYGDGNFIAELLKSQSEEQLANQIKELSESLNINNVNAIKQKSSTLRASLQRTVPKTPFKYLIKTLENFVKKFARSSIQESEYQLELAGWYFENFRYATGYITLAEAIITYVCEVEGRDIRNRNVREEMKDILHGRDVRDSKLAQLYFQVNPIRKSIAHALLEEGNQAPDVRNAINNAKYYYQELKTIFKTGIIE